ncbi:MAG: hypothetical protein AAF329_10590, partial [Cyanobacteria bacterium P01_A01_bin.17]
ESMRELVRCARDDISQRDESKPHVAKEHATHVGFGVFATARHFRYVEVIVTALVELDGVSTPENLCATELTLSGTMLRSGLGPFCARVYFDGGQNRDEEALFYEDFGTERVHVAWPWDFDFSPEDRSFSTRLKFGNELKASGFYYVQLFVKADPASISYDAEVQDIEIPGTTSVAATGLVLAVKNDQQIDTETATQSSSSLAEMAARKRAWDAAKAPDAEPLTEIAVFRGGACPEGFEYSRHADGIQSDKELFGVGLKRLALDEVDLTNEDAAEPQVVVDVALCSDDTPVPKGYDRLSPGIDDNLQLCVRYAPASDESHGLQAVVDIVVVYAASENFDLGAGYEEIALGSSIFLCLKREGAGRAAYLQAAQQGILLDGDADDQDNSDDDQELLDTELTPSKVRAREQDRLRLLEEAQALALS